MAVLLFCRDGILVMALAKRSATTSVQSAAAFSVLATSVASRSQSTSLLVIFFGTPHSSDIANGSFVHMNMLDAVFCSPLRGFF
jgi:hypothetical protein